MERLKRIWIRIRALHGRWGSRSTLTAGALAVLVGVGAVWLITTGQPPRVVITPPAGMSSAEAARELARRGIACDVTDGRVTVDAVDTPRAAHLMRQRFQAAPEAAAPASGADELWLTRSASDKRWRAATLAKLGRLVAQFPGVESAAVLYEPAKTGRIGQRPTEKTAAVHLRMSPGAAVSQQMVHAIADLVAGGLAEVDRSAIRVIDHRGVSYRVDEVALAGEVSRAARQAEGERCRREVLQRLSHVEQMTVTPDVTASDPIRCVGVHLTVPWTYFQAVARRRDVEPMIAAADESEHIRRVVADLLNLEDPQSVRIRAGFDDNVSTAARTVARPVGRELPPESAQPDRPARGDIAAGALFCLGLICGWAALRRRRRRNLAPAPSIAEPQPAASLQDNPAAALEAIGDDDLIWLLAGEQPRTVAAVLTCISRRRGAAVLAALDKPRQRLVIEQLAVISHDEHASADAAVRTVLARLDTIRRRAADTPTEAAGGTWSSAELSLDFEDIQDVPEPILRPAATALDAQLLAVALRTAGQAVRQRIFRALGRRRTRQIRRQMDGIGPVRLSEVEAAQDRVSAAVAEAIRRARPQLTEMAG